MAQGGLPVQLVREHHPEDLAPVLALEGRTDPNTPSGLRPLISTVAHPQTCENPGLRYHLTPHVQPSAKPSAPQISLNRSELSTATRRPRWALDTVTTLCRLTAHAPFIPSASVRRTLWVMSFANCSCWFALVNPLSCFSTTSSVFFRIGSCSFWLFLPGSGTTFGTNNTAIISSCSARQPVGSHIHRS